MILADTTRRPTPAAATARATRYAVQHDDGRYLAIGYAGSQPIALWTDRARAWTWDTYTQATMLGLRLLPGAIDWRIVAL